MNSSTNSRRNSFSSFVKNLLLLVSPSNNVNEDDQLERKLSASSSEYSPFQDMYFSFPAFEEPDESSSTCGQSHHQPYIAKSNRILC